MNFLIEYQIFLNLYQNVCDIKNEYNCLIDKPIRTDEEEQKIEKASELMNNFNLEAERMQIWYNELLKTGVSKRDLIGEFGFEPKRYYFAPMK